MAAVEMAQVTTGIGKRIEWLREGRGWTIADAAQRAEVTVDVWVAVEQAGEVPIDEYRRILDVFGFTVASMGFIERSVGQGSWQ